MSLPGLLGRLQSLRSGWERTRSTTAKNARDREDHTENVGTAATEPPDRLELHASPFGYKRTRERRPGSVCRPESNSASPEERFDG